MKSWITLPLSQLCSRQCWEDGLVNKSACPQPWRSDPQGLMVERENQFLQVVFWRPHSCLYTHTHEKVNSLCCQGLLQLKNLKQVLARVWSSEIAASSLCVFSGTAFWAIFSYFCRRMFFRQEMKIWISLSSFTQKPKRRMFIWKETGANGRL